MKRYCRICGQSRPCGQFLRGINVCKECSLLPIEKQREMEVINRIHDLPHILTDDQMAWLEKLENDSRSSVREAARKAAKKGQKEIELQRIDPWSRRINTMARTIWADDMHVGQKIWVEKPSDDDPDYIVLIPAEILEVQPEFLLHINDNDACDGFYRPGIRSYRYWDEKPSLHERWPGEY